MLGVQAKSVSDTSTLGDLLVANRNESGMDLEDLSMASSLTVEQILEVESGRHDLDASELRALLVNYEVPSIVGRLSRLAVEISLEDGWVTMSSTRRTWADQPDADQNLLSYLVLLYEDLGLKLGDPISLKSVDLSLLRAALALRRPEVEAQLDRLGNSIPDRLRRNKSLLVVAAAAGIAVVAGAITFIPAAQQPAIEDGAGSPQRDLPSVAIESADEQSVVDIDPRIDIGTPLVIERSAEVALLDSDAAPAIAGPSVGPQIEIGTAAVIERPATDIPATD